MDPDLFMLRDVLTEGEMNRLKELASPKVRIMLWVEPVAMEPVAMLHIVDMFGTILCSNKCTL